MILSSVSNMGYVMRLLNFRCGLSSQVFNPADGRRRPDFACSVAEIFECTAIAGCQRVSAAQAKLPPFVT